MPANIHVDGSLRVLRFEKEELCRHERRHLLRDWPVHEDNPLLPRLGCVYGSVRYSAKCQLYHQLILPMKLAQIPTCDWGCVESTHREVCRCAPRHENAERIKGSGDFIRRRKKTGYRS